MAQRALGYVRVSTGEQAESGLGIEAQRDRIEAWARCHDVALVGLVADEGVSGTTLDRPGLTEAFRRLAEGEADVLVVAKLDRLTRRVAHLGALLEGPLRDVALASVSESIDARTAAGRLVLNVLASVAEWERDTIVERTRDALAAKRRRGERAGSVPLGYRDAGGGRLEPDEHEQAAIARARALRADGRSLRAIAAALTAEGFRPRGKAWAPESVRRMLAA